MKATGSPMSQTPSSSRSTRSAVAVNGNVEDNHDDDDSIVNQGQSKWAVSSKKKKGLPLSEETDGEEITAIDIPALLDLVKAQEEEIAGLKETVTQLNLQVDKQSQLISGIRKRMRSSFLSWQSFWKENEEGEQDDESSAPSTSSRTTTPGRGPGRPPGSFAVKDLSKSPRKRGRPPKQYSKTAKSVSEPSTSAAMGAMSGGSGSSSGIMGDGDIGDSDDANDDDGDRVVRVDENPTPSTSGQAATPGRGRGRPRSTNWGFPVKDLNKSSRKRGRPSKQYLESVKRAKIESANLKWNGADGANDESESDNEVKDTSFVPYKMKQTVNNLKSKLRKASLGKKDAHRCDHCGKVYKTKGILKTHIESVHEDIRFKCPHCPGTFGQLVQLKVHRKLHEKKGGPPLEKCKVCGMALNGKKGVMIHMAVVHKIYAGSGSSASETSGGDDPFKCQLCKSTFKQRDVLRYHLNTSHRISGVEAEAVLEKISAAEGELDKILDAVEMGRKRKMATK